MNEQDRSLVLTLTSKRNAITAMLERIESKGELDEQSRKSLSWLFRTGASAVAAHEPPPGGDS